MPSPPYSSNMKNPEVKVKVCKTLELIRGSRACGCGMSQSIDPLAIDSRLIRDPKFLVGSCYLSRWKKVCVISQAVTQIYQKIRQPN